MSEENVALVRRVYEAFNADDVEGAVALADPPADFEFVPSGVLIPDFADTQRGADAIRRVFEALKTVFDDARFEIHELIDAGDDQVWAAFTLRGRGRRSGAETGWDGWTVTTVRESRITRVRGFTDRDAALEAAGLPE